MLTWLSRFLILVFVFNIITPELLWAQQSISGEKVGLSLAQNIRDQISASLDTPLSSAKSEQDLEKTYAAQAAKLRKIYDTLEVNDPLEAFPVLQDVVSQMHKLSGQYASVKQTFADKSLAQKQQERWEFSQTPQGKIMTQDATFVRLPDLMPVNLGNRFLERLAADELSLNDIVETLDPIEMHTIEGRFSNQPYTQLAPIANGNDSSAAGEVIYNTIDQALRMPQLSPEEVALWTALLPRLSARAYFGLDKIHTPTNADTITASGTKRLVLVQLHRLYKKLGLDDPLTTNFTETKQETTVQYMVPSRQTYQAYKKNLERQNATRNENQPVLVIPSYEQYVATHAAPATNKLPKGYEIQPRTLTSVEQNKQENTQLFDSFRDRFIQEMKSLQEKAEPGKEEMALLNLQTEYAVRYMLLAGYPEKITSMVKLLENNEGMIDFKIKYASALETLFSTLTDTGKLFPLPDATVQSIQAQLLNLSNFKHAFATRTLALASAGLLNVSDKWNAVQVAKEGYTHVTGTDYTNQEATNMKKAYGAVNNFKFSDKQRQELAHYAVNIYATMNVFLPEPIPGYTLGASTLNKVVGHGLDAKQIQALQKSLAVALDNLCPLPAYKAVWNDEEGFKPDTSRRLMVDTIQGKVNKRVLKGRKQNRTYETADPVFLFDLSGTPRAIYFDPAINPQRDFNDKAKIVMDLLFETALWVYGGELIIFIPRVLTKLGGFFVTLPKAAKVFNTAAKGEKLHSAWQTAVKGYKYASTNARATHIGATVTTTRIENTMTRGEKLRRATNEAAEAATRAQNATRYAQETARVAGESTQAAEIAAKAQQNAREATRLAEQTAKQMEEAQQAVNQFGAQSFIQAPVTRFGSSYYSPTAMDLGTERVGAKWLERLFGGSRPEIESIAITQGDRTIMIGKDQLLEMGIKNPKRLSVADKIMLWEEKVNPWLNENPFNYKRPGWLHPFDFDRWYSLRAGWTNGIGKTTGTAAAGTRQAEEATRVARELLKVEPGASAKELAKAYQKTSLLYHPDALWGKSVKETRSIVEGALARTPKEEVAKRELLEKILAENAAEGETLSQVTERTLSKMSPAKQKDLLEEYFHFHGNDGGVHAMQLKPRDLVSQSLGWKQEEVNAAYNLLQGGKATDLGTIVTQTTDATADATLWNKTKSAAKSWWEQTQSTLTAGDVWFAKSYWANFKIWSLWMLGDLAAYPAQFLLMDETITQQTQRELDKYGNTFKPDPDAPAVNPYASQARVNTYATVNQANNGYHAFRGALVSTPILTGMVIGGKDFMKGQAATQININAKKIELMRAQNKRTNLRNQKSLDNVVQAQLKKLATSKESFKQILANDNQGAYTKEYKAILRELTNAEKSLRKIKDSKDNTTKKWQAYNEWLSTPALQQAIKAWHQKWFDNQLETLQENINDKTLSAQWREDCRKTAAQLKKLRLQDQFEQANQLVAQLNKTQLTQFSDTLYDAYQVDTKYSMARTVTEFWQAHAFLKDNDLAQAEVLDLVNLKTQELTTLTQQVQSVYDLPDAHLHFLLEFEIALESIATKYKDQLPLAQQQQIDTEETLRDLQQIVVDYKQQILNLADRTQLNGLIEQTYQEAQIAIQNIAQNNLTSVLEKRLAYNQLLIEIEDQLEAVCSQPQPVLQQEQPTGIFEQDMDEFIEEYNPD